MPTRCRNEILILLAAFALAACASEAEPKGCHSDDACPSASRCQAGVCVGDGPPVAAIQPVGAVEAFALVQLDGSGSHDPDRDDTIVEHLWTVRAVTARCAPPEIAGRTPVAAVRFGCPGRYDVSLVVRDRLGLESQPGTVTVEILPSTRTPAVVAGPDLSTEHACSGEPLACRPVDPVVLSASAAPGLSLRWSVEPPADRPLADGTRRVTFSGTPESPLVNIETDGTAISGDWIFRVEAYDAYGAVGAAYTRVSVRNRAPVLVTNATAPFPHAFDAVRSRFTSSGAIGWTATDPDGDPLEVAATWRHVGDGGAPFAGQLRGDTVTFALEVPYAAPADALNLLGGPDLARSIELVARDPNRAEGRATIDVEIGNRPPAPAGGTIDTRVPHTFDAARSRYVAAAQLGTWTDPDGDPLSVAPGAAPCDAVSIRDGDVRVECSVPYSGTPAVDQIAGLRVVPARVRDPFGAASSAPDYRIEILNSPPEVSVVTDGPTLYGTVAWGFTMCTTTHYVEGGTFVSTPTIVDRDGDPVLVTAATASPGTVSPARAICTNSSCVPFQFVQAPYSYGCPWNFVPPSSLTISDGAAGTVTYMTPPIVFR